MDIKPEIASFLAKTAEHKKIILLDGVCNLCNSAVQFIIKHDKKDAFRFVALQSKLGQEILEYIGIDSKVLYEPGLAYYYKSDAALQIARNLDGFFLLSSVFKILPIGIRNQLYD